MLLPLNLHEVIEESRAGADVRQLLRNELIDVRMTGTQLVPPDRKRNRDAGFYPVGYSGYKPAFASIIPHSHRITIIDSAVLGVLRAELDERLAFALQEAAEVRERSIQK